MKRDDRTSNGGRASLRAGFLLLASSGLLAIPLLGCPDDDREEAVEEMQDEMDDAADEIRDEIDDHT